MKEDKYYQSKCCESGFVLAYGKFDDSRWYECQECDCPCDIEEIPN